MTLEYYPFGLQQKGYNNIVQNENSVAHNFGYSGKENNPELGLEWMDFGARNYDAALGRWMNIDPLAEKYFGINPYAYIFNNPVQLFDPDGMRVKYLREEGQSRKEFRQAKREFKSRNRELSKNSQTHKANFQQLKKSDNTHNISFNRGKGSGVEEIGDKNNETGNDTNINIDLDQQSDGNQGNEFVIAHEVGHAVADDNGTSSPFDYNPSLTDTDIVGKVLENNAKNAEFNESQGSHVENVVRGEVSQSTGTHIPLRKTYTINVESYSNGRYDVKKRVINVIRKNYDYYGGPDNKKTDD